MASPFFSGRIPQELSDRIDQHIKESGEGKTQILINALSQYLSVEVPKPKSSGVNTDLFLSELESLKERVCLLERSQPKQLSLLSPDNVDDNKMITKFQGDNIAVIKSDNKPNNSIMVLTSKEVTELTSIPRGTFEDRHKAGKLPMTKNGYTVVAHAGKQTEKPFANLWKVQTDNS